VNRWLALFVAIIAGGACAFVLVLGFTVATLGVLWIYIFGDDPWPPWVGTGLDVVVPLVGVASWAGAAWIIWKRLSDSPRAG
jgi:hypothetical protein